MKKIKIVRRPEIPISEDARKYLDREAWAKNLGLLIQRLEETGEILPDKLQKILVGNIAEYAVSQTRKLYERNKAPMGSLKEYLFNEVRKMPRGIVFSFYDFSKKDFFWNKRSLGSLARVYSNELKRNFDACKITCMIGGSKRVRFIKPTLKDIKKPKFSKKCVADEIIVIGHILNKGYSAGLENQWRDYFDDPSRAELLEKVASEFNLPLGRNLEGKTIIVYHPQLLRKLSYVEGN